MKDGISLFLFGYSESGPVSVSNLRTNEHLDIPASAKHGKLPNWVSTYYFSAPGTYLIKGNCQQQAFRAHRLSNENVLTKEFKKVGVTFDSPERLPNQVIDSELNSSHERTKYSNAIYLEYIGLYILELFKTGNYQGIVDFVDAHAEPTLLSLISKASAPLKLQTLSLISKAYGATGSTRLSNKYSNEFIEHYRRSNNDSDYWKYFYLLHLAEVGHSHAQKGLLNQKSESLIEAEAIMREVIDVIKSEPLADIQIVGDILSTVASYQMITNQPMESEKSHIEAINVLKISGAPRRAAQTLNNLYLLYTWYARKDQAHLAITEALRISNSVGSVQDSLVYQSNLASSYIELGMFDRARDSLEISINNFKEKNRNFSLALAMLKKGKLLRLNAEQLSGPGNQKIYNEAIEIQQDVALFFLTGDWTKKDKTTTDALKPVSITHFLRAKREILRINISLNLKQEAKNNFDEITKWEKRTGSNSNVFLPSQVDSLKAKLTFYAYVRNKTQFYKTARALEEKLTSNADFFTLDKLDLAFESLKFRIENDLPIVDDLLFQTVASHILDVHSQLDSDYLGVYWSNNISKKIDYFFKALLEFNRSKDDKDTKIASLFNFLETFHALSFRASRDSTSSKFNSKEEQLLRERALASAIQGEVTKLNSINPRLDRADNHQKLWLASLDRTELKNRGALSINEIQNKLSPNEIMLRYYLRANISLVFKISSFQIELVELDNSFGFEKEVQQFNQLLINRSSSIKLKASLLASNLSLNEHDLEPFDKVLIVTDGHISSLPFGALDIKIQTELYRPIGVEKQIVVVPNITEYFDSKRQTETIRELDIAIFANPHFKNQGYAERQLIDSDSARFRNWSESLTALPGTEKEAYEIRKLFYDKKVLVFKGQEATTNTLMSNVMRRAKIQHIASHGYFDSNTPELVGIATTPDPPRDAAGFLTISEFLSKSMNSNLVVISGCETARGKYLVNEGSNSLMRATMSKGAGSVIATLWSIPDRPTALFMKKFYEHLKLNEGNSSRALQLTKKFFFEHKRFGAPYYWAGFVLGSSSRNIEHEAFR